MTPPISLQDRRRRRMLVALALFFFAPLAVSFYLYYGSGGWRPARHVNRGDLIDPARPLPELARPSFKGKWTILYWGPGSCPVRCRTNLYNSRQVRIALNRDMDRVQRVFIAAGACCDWPYLDREHPDLVTVRSTADAERVLALLPAVDGVPPATADRLYLIDPLGNLMMSYAPDAKAKGLLLDLKRLLGLSQVG